MHVDYPAEFGIFMVNLARELAREIEMLEDVIGCGTGLGGKRQGRLTRQPGHVPKPEDRFVTPVRRMCRRAPQLPRA